jgi:hypothetical protein
VLGSTQVQLSPIGFTRRKRVVTFHRSLDISDQS